MVHPKTRRLFEHADDEGYMLTYDDLRLRPRYSEVTPDDPSLDLSTRISRRVALKAPIVSAPMDTVTTARMAIAMAEMGCLGVIQRGLSPEAQAKEVGRVKNRLHGRVETPIVVRSSMTVAQVLSMRKEKEYAFTTFPVVDANGKLLGLITQNDFDFCTDPSVPVTDIMTPRSRLTTGPEEISAADALKMMRKHKKKVLPLVTRHGKLAHLYVHKDVLRTLSPQHNYNVDKSGRLIVAAAIGVGKGAMLRAKLLAPKGCDIFHVDTAHGDSKNVHETIKRLKREYPDVDVIGGNVSDGEAALRLAEVGVDGVMVGQGPGSICTTRVIAGIGVPQATAIYECIEALADTDVPVCADGGARSSGDMVIALALGASSIMVGSMLAGTEETPGDTYFWNGRQVKDYRGMGSIGAMRASAASRERYGQSGTSIQKLVPEGIEGVVDYKGPMRPVVEQYLGGIRAGMGYTGSRTLAEISKGRVGRMSMAGLNESHPHDITITREAPNYKGRSA